MAPSPSGDTPAVKIRNPIYTTRRDSPLPDWRGRSHLALAHAAHLAGLGCTTLVADLYGEGYNPTDSDQVSPLVQQLLGHRARASRPCPRPSPHLRETTGQPALPVIVVAFSAGAVAALDHGRRTQEAAAIVICSGLLQDSRTRHAHRDRLTSATSTRHPGRGVPPLGDHQALSKRLTKPATTCG